MPAYEFDCKRCGERVEVEASMRDAGRKFYHKPGCSGRLLRVFSNPQVNIRGKAPEVIEDGNATITKHYDGRQDVTVKPPRVNLKAQPKKIG